MKSLHFCTPKLVSHIKRIEIGEYFYTCRTGWIPELYPRHVIRCNERAEDQPDALLTYGLVHRVSQVPYAFFSRDFQDGQDLYLLALEEIARYRRKFHPLHTFFQICLQKLGSDESQIHLLSRLLVGGATRG